MPQQGTSVAVRLGNELRRSALEMSGPPDLVDDLQQRIDTVIVHVLRATQKREDLAQLSKLLGDLVETYGVLVEVVAARRMKGWSQQDEN